MKGFVFSFQPCHIRGILPGVLSRARDCDIGGSRKPSCKRARFLLLLCTDITVRCISRRKEILSVPHSVPQPFLKHLFVVHFVPGWSSPSVPSKAQLGALSHDSRQRPLLAHIISIWPRLHHHLLLIPSAFLWVKPGYCVHSSTAPKPLRLPKLASRST